MIVSAWVPDIVYIFAESDVLLIRPIPVKKKMNPKIRKTIRLLVKSLPCVNSKALYTSPIMPSIVKSVPKILFKFITVNVLLKKAKRLPRIVH